MKRPLQLAALLFATVSLNASAQSDCGMGRYTNYSFAPGSTVTSAVTYGQNIAVGSTSNTVLKLDVYQPEGDTYTSRPVVIVAFGGSFIGGARTDGDVVDLCETFAKLGYVAIAPDYRVGFFFPINEVSTTLAVMRGMHDLKGVVRFLRKSVAENSNPYGIDPDRIYVGGISAGAIAAIHCAYMDRMEEIPAYMVGDTAGLGGIEGNSGSLGYSSRPNGVFSMSGAIGDTSWVETDDIPLISLHEEGDGVVPYNTQEVAVQGFPTGLTASGSNHMHQRADNSGTDNCFRSYTGTGHVGYLGYDKDNAVGFIASFFAQLSCGQETDCSINTGISEAQNTLGFSVSPNPSSGIITVNTDRSFGPMTFELFDVAGKLMLSGNASGERAGIDLSALPKGIYALRLSGKDAVGTQRVIRN